MNKEEIKFDHFKDIEELIQHLEMWYAEDDYYAYDRYFHLRDAIIMGMFIYELQQENKQLKEVIEEIRKTLKLERKTALSLNQVYTVSVIDSVLQILDKGESNE